MAIYDFLLKADSVDTSTYSFYPARLDGNWDLPAKSFDEVSVPGRRGTTRTAIDPTYEPLDLQITGTIRTATESAFETACDLFRYAMDGSIVTIICGNQDARKRTGYVKGIRISPTYTDLRWADVSFTVHCEDPAAYSTSSTTVSGATATDHALAMGLRKTWGVVTLTFSGSVASTTLTYKNYAGTTIGTPMVLTHGFVNTDVLVIDMDARTVKLNGARQDGYITAGDFFAFDPHDGTPSLSQYPTLRSSVGAISITYTKAY